MACLEFAFGLILKKQMNQPELRELIKLANELGYEINLNPMIVALLGIAHYQN